MKSSTPRDAVRLSPNAVTVLEKRYLVKDETGRPVETPSDLFQRVARTVAEAERRYGASGAVVDQVTQDFFGLMANRLFVPNSPTLMNAGRPLGQLSACFVLPVEEAIRIRTGEQGEEVLQAHGAGDSIPAKPRFVPNDMYEFMT